MEARIAHAPELSYDAFVSVDRACFPAEPTTTEGAYREMRNGEFWGAYVGDALVGFSHISVHQVGHLHRIAVLPQYRRRGIATQLLGAGMALCRERGLQKAILSVQTDNTAAVDMYRDHGFVHVDSRYQFLAPLRSEQRSLQDVESLRAVPVCDLAETSRARLPEQWRWMLDRHAPPRHLMLALLDGQATPRGMARLAPDMPGCMPFELQQPAELLSAATKAIGAYVGDKFDGLFLTFADPAIAEACRKHGFSFRYELSRMEKNLQ